MALDIHREVGDRRSQGIHLGNLGDALYHLGRLDEAETALRGAIVVGDETSPHVAGAFRGSLALLLAHQAQLGEAWAQLKLGEAQVEGYPEEYAKFLCKKGHICLSAGRPEEAIEALRRAQQIAAELSVGAQSQVGRSLEQLKAGIIQEPASSRS